MYLSCLSLLFAGCAAGDRPGGEGPDSPDVSAADSAALDASLLADSIGFEEDVFEESPIPLLPGEGEPREYRLLLVNHLDRDAYVFASAGASRVALDTVPGTDSLFVDIRLRADRVDLEAEDEDGSLVSAASLDLVRSTINRWEIRSTDADQVAARRSPTPAWATMLENSDARRSAGRRSR